MVGLSSFFSLAEGGPTTSLLRAIMVMDGISTISTISVTFATRPTETAVCGRLMTSYPFGVEIAKAYVSNDHHHEFTSKERDSESGLDNFGARYNSSQMGAS